MYKITLYDYCCSPICDGTHWFLTENLEEFEKNWLPLQTKHSIDCINRYYKSKFGEIVTDYYSDNPELNIVQNVDFEIIDSKEYECKDIDIELENTYSYETIVNFDRIIFKIVKAQVNDRVYLLGQYKGFGGKRLEPTYNRWYDKETKYCQMRFKGNPVASYKMREPDWVNIRKGDAYKDFYTDDKAFFSDEVIETFVWLPIQEIAADYELKELDKEQLKVLLRDIVGEEG